MLLPHGVTRLLRKVERLSAHPPASDDPLALFEVFWHVGGVALIARVDVVVEALPRPVDLVVALVQHHVMHVRLVALSDLGQVANQVMLTCENICKNRCKETSCFKKRAPFSIMLSKLKELHTRVTYVACCKKLRACETTKKKLEYHSSSTRK